jgi:hypothetical protein
MPPRDQICTANPRSILTCSAAANAGNPLVFLWRVRAFDACQCDVTHNRPLDQDDVAE